MKIYILLTMMIIAIGAVLYFRKKETIEKAPHIFVLPNDAAPSEELMPLVESDWLENVHKTFEDKEYNKYDNEHYVLSERLCNQVYSDYKYWEHNLSHAQFLNQLNDIQKMYFALINFEGQTNNGGVYQFLFNQPENAIIALEAMKMAKLEQLASDYEIVLEQFFGKFETIEDLRNTFQSGNLNWDKRWNAFVEGYREIPQAEVIEEYFYTDKYSKEFHTKMVLFVMKHQSELMRVQ